MKNTKQVLIVRKDLNMRKGKIGAQCSHAAMAFITKGMVGRVGFLPPSIRGDIYANDAEWCGITEFPVEHVEEINHWLENSFRKIVCYVESEQALIDLYDAAKAKGLMVHIITDNGATEFNGVPTKTCLAIGPGWDDTIDEITKWLPLF